jgi:hypothetical protein
MRRPRLVPSMYPCTLIQLVRQCVPDDGPIREAELRKLTREMDAVAAEVTRADARRYDDEREAA